MRQPEEEEPLLVRRTRAINAVVFGGGQLALAALLVVAAIELAPLEAPGGAVSPRAIAGLLAAFALFALVRGVRQLVQGVRGVRALKDAPPDRRRDR